MVILSIVLTEGEEPRVLCDILVFQAENRCVLHTFRRKVLEGEFSFIDIKLTDDGLFRANSSSIRIPSLVS